VVASVTVAIYMLMWYASRYTISLADTPHPGVL
jgi:hypothetical protein